MRAISMKRRKLIEGLVALPVLLRLLVVDTAHAHEEGDHSEHGAMAPRPLKRSMARYEVPDVTLTDANGKTVALRAALAEDAPLMLNFIFTSCTTICPVMSGVFAQVQSRFAQTGKRVRMISISIDPEHDTPERLMAYAKNFSAGPDWVMLTGRLGDSVAIQHAFDAYRGDKMNHEPITYLRAGTSQPWLRLEGLASADELVKEYNGLTRQ
ncbi:MAG: SCO family protein [Propionivibrio sp.]